VVDVRVRGGDGSDLFCTSLLAEEVVLVVAGVDVDAAVFDLEDARGEAVDEVAIVRDEEDGSAEAANRVEEDILGAHVEMVGGLVEEKEVGWGDEHLGHGVAIALAAGEDSEGLEHIVAGKHEAAEERSQRDDIDLWIGARDVVEHLRGAVKHLVLILREVVGEHVVAEADLAGGGSFEAAEHADHRRFTRAVRARREQCGHLARW